MPTHRGIELVLQALESMPEIRAYRAEFERLKENQSILSRRQSVDACARVRALQYSSAMGCSPHESWRHNRASFIKQAKAIVRKLRHAQRTGSAPPLPEMWQASPTANSDMKT